MWRSAQPISCCEARAAATLERAPCLARSGIQRFAKRLTAVRPSLGRPGRRGAPRQHSHPPRPRRVDIAHRDILRGREDTKAAFVTFVSQYIQVDATTDFITTIHRILYAIAVTSASSLVLIFCTGLKRENRTENDFDHDASNEGSQTDTEDTDEEERIPQEFLRRVQQASARRQGG